MRRVGAARFVKTRVRGWSWTGVGVGWVGVGGCWRGWEGLREDGANSSVWIETIPTARTWLPMSRRPSPLEASNVP